ncbi:MAG: carboxypeptidase regulatory-like domain-containing protein [Planctomycetes bacterium]|nr:carboxypeptidase regulatory-like domain-containing protein [Planctomycetota bacterium]
MNSGRALVVLGGLVAVAVGVALWLALGTDDVPGGGESGGPNAPAVTGVGGATPDRTPRKRSKTSGTAVVTGVVKRRTHAGAAAGATPSRGAGQAVDGQEVRLLRDGKDVGTATTADGGTFRIDGLADGGPYEVQVAAKGCATVRLPGIGLSRGETRDVGTIWLDLAVRVPVVVRDFANRPIAGAQVQAFVAPEYGEDFDWSKAFSQMALEPVALAKTVTGADGKAEFPDLASGHWTFVASAAGRARGAAKSVELRGGETPDEVVIRLAKGYSLRGRVVDPERVPVSGAVVLAGAVTDAWDAGSAATRSRAVSDAEGKFTFDTLDAGTVSLSVGRSGAVPSWRSNVRVPGVEEIDLVLRPTGSIEGRVTQKETGAAVVGAIVRAAQWGWTTEVAEATTDEQGKYRIPTFPEGDVQELKAEKDGLVFTRPENEGPWGGSGARVHAGDTLTKDLVMQKGSVVTGRVMCGGVPAVGAKVKINSYRVNQGQLATATAVTGTDGRYRAEDVTPGSAFGQVRAEGSYQKGFPEQWWMMAQDDSLGREFRVEVPEGGEATLDLTLERGASVTGKVEGPDGPVGGARVFAPGAEATSAADGTFALDGVVPGDSVTIGATKAHLLTSKNSTFPVIAGRDNSGVVVTLVHTPVVRGKVVGPDGAPPAEARVSAAPKSENTNLFGVGGSDVFTGSERFPVNPDGTFEFPLAMLEGAFTVRAVDARLGTAESVAVTIESGRREYEVSIQFAQPDGLRGRVTSGGKPVAGAEIQIAPHQEANGMMMAFSVLGGGNGQVVYAVSGPTGAFEVRPLEAGSWDVTARAAGYVKSKAVAATVPSTTGDVIVEMQEEMEISGRVTFPDGTPVEGLSVHPVADNGMNGFSFPAGMNDEASTATTARDGSFRLRSLAPGAHKLRVEGGWMSTVNAQPITTDPIAAGTKTAKIVVQPGGRIAGRVIDSARKPVAGVWVSASSSDPAAMGEWRGAVTGATGAFEITALATGSYMLNAQSQGGNRKPAQKAGVAVGTTDVELVMEDAATIEGVALRADGTPAAGVFLSAEPVAETAADPSGNDSPDSTGAMKFGGGQSAMTDAAGKFKIGGLGTGRHRIKLGGWDDASKALRIEGEVIVAAGATGVQVRLVEGLRIAGTVVDENGAGIAGANVMAYTDGGHARSAVSGKDGRFAVSGLVEGDYHVNASADERVPASVEKVAAGTSDLRFTLPKGGKVSGRVTDAAGKPFSGQIHLRAVTGGGDNWAQCDAEGRFTATGLREGEWDVEAFRADPEHPDQWSGTPLGRVRTGTTDADLRLQK